jgi:hypothetical protein
MTYPFIPFFLILVFGACLIYFSLIKKDPKKTKAILYPGVFFSRNLGNDVLFFA